MILVIKLKYNYETEISLEKTAILIFDVFCNFEISMALEMFMMEE